MRRPDLRIIAALTVGSLVVLYATSASAFLVPDADSATLVAILNNAIKTVATLNQQLGELQRVYAETKRLAAYAEDSRQAFTALTQLDFAHLEFMVETSVPNAGYFAREARFGYQSWGQGSGELQAMLSLCLGDREAAWKAAADAQKGPGLAKATSATNAADVEAWRRGQSRGSATEDACAALQRRLSGQEVTLALERLFGSPASASGTRQAAEARLSADAQQVRDTARAETARKLLGKCRDVSGADFDACQAAALNAEVGSYQQLVELTDQVADLNRTEANRLAQETAERERLRREAENRNRMLQQGIEDLPTQAPRIDAPGFTFSDQL